MCHTRERHKHKGMVGLRNSYRHQEDSVCNKPLPPTSPIPKILPPSAVPNQTLKTDTRNKNPQHQVPGEGYMMVVGKQFGDF